MPVLPFIPLIVGGVSAATGVVSAVNANNNAKKQLSIEQQLANAQQDLIAQQKKGAELAYGQAQQFLPKGAEYLDLVGSNWKKIFSGNRDAVNATPAPDVNNYLGSMGNVNRNLNLFAGRGAIGDRLISQMTQSNNYLSNLRFGARNSAATNLQNLGSIFNNAGLNALAISGGQAANASATLLGQQQIALGQAANYQNQAGGIGASLGTLLNAFNWKAGNITDILGIRRDPERNPSSPIDPGNPTGVGTYIPEE